MSTVEWHDWNPGLDNDDMTLQAVVDSLPGAQPQEVSKLVRLFENPESPLALTGAVSLERHDCIHIVLGRGLLGQDEAFVIGFTMGTAKHIHPLEVGLFKKISRFLYPRNYRMSKRALIAYDLGFEAGKRFATYHIYDFPFEDHMSWTVGKVRRELGIDKAALKAAYAAEKKALPRTKASKRLPV